MSMGHEQSRGENLSDRACAMHTLPELDILTGYSAQVL